MLWREKKLWVTINESLCPENIWVFKGPQDYLNIALCDLLSFLLFLDK